MKLAVIFNGQGAHYENMGQDFAENHIEAKEIYDLAEAVTQQPLRDWINGDINRLSETRYAQPTIVATSVAIFEAIKQFLPAISLMAGLSLGEYSALIASETLTKEEGFALVKQRGEIMSEHCRHLASETAIQMAAVIDMPLDEINTLIEKIHTEESPLYLANYNSPKQHVIAGSKEGISGFRKQAKELGYRKVIPLKVEGPFHTPLMQPVLEPFKQELAKVEFKEAKVPVLSNLTVEPHRVDTIQTNLLAHFIRPVRWYQTIDEMKGQGITHIIQIGPGNTLVKLLNNDQDLKIIVVDEESDIDALKLFLIEGGEV